MAEQHTIRGVTGTVEQLIVAFGVQIGKSTIYMRIKEKHWSFERALLYPGRGGRAPIHLDDPLPIENPGPHYHWDTQKERIEKELDSSAREIIMVLISMGLSNDDVKGATGLRVSSSHFKSLQKKVEKVRASAATAPDHLRVRQTQREWRMRHFARRQAYGKPAAS